jgi:hypothetical protein
VENSNEIRDGVIGTTYTGIFKETQAFPGIDSSQSNRSKLFLGSVQHMIYLNPGGENINFLRLYGQFKYAFMGNKSAEEIHEISRRLGFMGELNSSSFSNKKEAELDQITVDILLSQKSMVELMNWANSSDSIPLIRSSKAKIKEWFSNASNRPVQLCDTLQKAICEMEISNETQKGIQMAYESLKKMYLLMPSGNEYSKQFQNKLRGLSIEMAHFGEGFIKTQFSLNAILDILKERKGDKFMIVQWRDALNRGQRILIPSSGFSFKGNQVCGQRPNMNCGKPGPDDPL